MFADRLPDKLRSFVGPIVLFGVLIVAKLAFVIPETYGPVVFNDEALYRQFAESLFHLRFYDSTQYPPLYPLLLAPAFLFGPRFYEAMLAINVVVSSAVVFPAYGIARLHMGRRASFWCAMVVGVLPFHIVFPRSLLSENLYFPLLLTAVYLVLLTPQRHRLALDALTGALIGSLYLTRHISLVLIPPLLLAWWLKPLPPSERGPLTRRGVHLGVLLMSAFATYAPWLLANLHVGNPVKEILGFGIASRTNPDQLTLPRMATVAAAYLSYFALLAAPLTGTVLVSPMIAVRRGLRSAYGRLAVLVWGCAAAVFVAVVRHSWRAHYNFPEFTKLMGRYPLHFAGLFVILGFVTLLAPRAEPAATTARDGMGSERHMVLLGGIAGGFMVFAAWAVIVDRSVIHLVARMSDRGAVDGYRLLLVGRPIMWAAIGLAVLYAVTGWLGKRRALEAILAVTLTVYSLWGADMYIGRLRERQVDALFARRAAAVATARHPRGIALTFDESAIGAPTEPERFCRGVRFWGVPARYDAEGKIFILGSQPEEKVRLTRLPAEAAVNPQENQLDPFEPGDYRLIGISLSRPARGQ